MTNQKPICRKVYVNRAGYAYSGMQYFGHGHQLWYVEFPDGTNGHVRAQSRKEAIEEAKTRPRYWGIHNPRLRSNTRPLYELIISYTNGSEDYLPFSQYAAVRDFYQYSISYLGGRVARVEVRFDDDSKRAIWDASWTEHSKIVGLNQ